VLRLRRKPPEWALGREELGREVRLPLEHETLGLEDVRQGEKDRVVTPVGEIAQKAQSALVGAQGRSALVEEGLGHLSRHHTAAHP
jgi:hypothetical protein